MISLATPTGATGGARPETAGPPRHLRLAPGVARILAGLVICLPGGLLLALAILFLSPGIALVASGLSRLTTVLEGRRTSVGSRIGARYPWRPNTWTAHQSGGMH
jgi:uncharacterized membrane protein HdeD (DUF308 family)